MQKPKRYGVRNFERAAKVPSTKKDVGLNLHDILVKLRRQKKKSKKK